MGLCSIRHEDVVFFYKGMNEISRSLEKKKDFNRSHNRTGFFFVMEERP